MIRDLPDFDFASLTAQWPYVNPHCVRDTISRKNERGIDLSICIPAFNAENTIIKLLKQIDSQRTSFKVEVLIVNDGSTDQTGLIVEQFIAGKDNYHLYHQENAGLSDARNKAIDNSSGRYLTFLACNKIFTREGIKITEFSGIDRIFADAIINKDYAAWRMAADYALVYNKFHRRKKLQCNRQIQMI